jgi:hypothetical protein
MTTPPQPPSDQSGDDAPSMPGAGEPVDAAPPGHDRRLREWWADVDSLAPDAPPRAVLRVFVDGVRLLGAFSIDSPRTEPIAEALLRLTARGLTDLGDNAADDCAQAIDRLLSELDADFTRRGGDPTLSPGDHLELIERLASQLDALRPIVLPLVGREWDPYLDLLAKVDAAEREVGAAPRPRRLKRAVRDSLGGFDQVRADVLGRHAQALVERIRAETRAGTASPGGAAAEGASPQPAEMDLPLPAQTEPLGEADRHAVSRAEQIWELAFIAEKLLTHMNAVAAGAPELRESADELRRATDELLGQIDEVLAGCADSARREWLTAHARQLHDWCAEILTESEELPLAAASFAMRRGRKLIDAYMELWHYDDRPAALRKLRKLRRKLHNEWVEKETASRMAGRFGLTFVKTLDTVVLALIAVVIVLLVVEFTLHPAGEPAPTPAGAAAATGDSLPAPHEVPHDIIVLAYIDLFICIIFLAEFMLKIGHAPRRLNYLRRHFISDLLPSLPFSLIVIISHSAPGLTNVVALRVLRFGRVGRMMRFVRVLLFIMRGMDRVVRRYGRMLNRQVVLFEPPPSRDSRLRLIEHIDVLSRRLRLHRRQATIGADYDTQFGAVERALRHTLGRSQFQAAILAMPGAAGATSDDAQRAAERAAVSAERRRRTRGNDREVRVEAVIDGLLNADASTIETTFDPFFPRQIERLSRWLALPPFRWMPGFRAIVKARRDGSDPTARAAGIARALGSWAQRQYDRILWFVDMRGVVTAPELVDRFGGMLVQMTRRPTQRLLMIAGALGAFWVLAEVIGAAAFHRVAGTLKEGFEVIAIIGVIAGMLLMLGRWLQNIASTATGFYQRAAAAQFIGLLCDAKQARAVIDQSFLYRRILRPELRARGLDGANTRALGVTETGTLIEDEPDPGDHSVQGGGGLADEDYIEASSASLAPPDESVAAGSDDVPTDPAGVPALTDIESRSATDLLDAPTRFRRALRRCFGASGSRNGGLAERIYLLYRDYLLASPLHRTSTSTTNQLLGNVGIVEIIDRILRLGPAERKELEALDLQSGSGSMAGPGVWFNLITLSVAQRTAQLIVEYNRNAIPLEELGARPLDQRHKYEEWKTHKARELRILEHADSGRAGVPDVDDADMSSALRAKLGAENEYSTTGFTAIDFLTTERKRTDDIAERFGEDIAHMVGADRRRMIRDIFGTLPGSKGSQVGFNLYDLYWDHMSGLRFLTLPFKLAWVSFRLSGRAFGWFVRVVRRLLNPSLATMKYEPSRGSYHVAVRKVHRMRRPVLLAATRLRAMMDLEYLGLLLPGETASGLETDTLLDDLQRFQIDAAKQREFQDLVDQRRRDLVRFADRAQRLRLVGDGLRDRLETAGLRPERFYREVLRALTTAYLVDYKNLRALSDVGAFLPSVVERALASKGRLPNESWARWCRRAMLRAAVSPFTAARRVFAGRSKDEITFEAWFRRYMARHRKNLPDELRAMPRARMLDALRHWWRHDVDGMRRLVWVAAHYSDAQGAIEDVVAGIVGNPGTWTEHVVTLRTVQSLAILDIEADIEIVKDLGEFADAETPAGVVVVPTL